MIKAELLEKYGLTGDTFENHPLDLYLKFLSLTDYVACKIAESQFLGTALDEDYTEVLMAREYAREQIRLLEVTNG